MDVRQSIHSAHAKTLDTQGLRNEFLVEKVFVADEYTMVYSHIDRIIVGGIMPITKTVSVGGEVGKQLGVSYFLERRELGVINIGGAGTITVDGQCYEIGHRDALYVGKGAKEVVFASIDTATPAKSRSALRKMEAATAMPFFLKEYGIREYISLNFIRLFRKKMAFFQFVAPGLRIAGGQFPVDSVSGDKGVCSIFNVEFPVFHLIPEKKRRIVQ